MEPNEVVHTWEDKGELLSDLLRLLRDPKSAVGPAVWQLGPGEEWVAGTQFSNLALQDASGESLRFPVRLVAATSFPDYRP